MTLLDVSLLVSALSLALLLIITITNVLTGAQLRTPAPHKNQKTKMPRVSILVPARNEEQNIASCLDSLLLQEYEEIEILVLDDESTDSTARIVDTYQNKSSTVRLIAGKPLPEGWIGKPWACKQLGDAALGDILLFTDADTTHESFAVGNTVTWMEQYKLGMFSAFSQQYTVSLLEKMVIPFIDMLVYALLPMRLVDLTRFSSIAGANGQWIAFSREAYERIGGHSSVKDKIVDDIELSRVVKRVGCRAMTAAGTGAVYCRMYRSSAEVWKGFSKNFYAIANNNLFLFTLGAFFFLLTFVFPYASLFLKPGIETAALVLANILFRLLISLRYKHPLLISILLHPVTALVTIATAVGSLVTSLRNRIEWKGRRIDMNQLGTGEQL
jgi:chlorobactene glucosyltransferase